MFDDIEREAAAAQEDEAVRNNFIEQHRHFILAAACKAAGHFVTASDDEYSIALIAFNEAIDAFEPGKGSFHALATLVIKRRVYDYIRSQSRFSGELTVAPEALSGDVDEDSESAALYREVQRKEIELSQENTDTRPESTPVKDEIEAVQALLARYGFSFFDLADCSPKAEKTKRACADAVNYILKHEELITKMRASKNLPVKEIKENAGVSRKILERHRKYIIAAIEILNGDYPLLAEYMNYIRKALDP